MLAHKRPNKLHKMLKSDSQTNKSTKCIFFSTRKTHKKYMEEQISIRSEAATLKISHSIDSKQVSGNEKEEKKTYFPL